MAKPSVDVEAWPGETLISTLLASRASDASASASATSVSEASSALLCDLGGISGLARATVEEIEQQLAQGPRLRMTPRDAARRVAAAFELGRRAANDSLAPASITSSADVATWASTRLRGLDHEELWLLALDGRSRLRAIRCVAKGGLHGMGVRPADPFCANLVCQSGLLVPTTRTSSRPQSAISPLRPPVKMPYQTAGFIFMALRLKRSSVAASIVQ